MPLRLTQFSNYAIRVLMYAALKLNAPSAVPEIARSYEASYDHLKKEPWRHLCRRGYTVGTAFGWRRTRGRFRINEVIRLIVQAENGKTINLHLGPAAALEDVLDQLSAGQQMTFEAFRTDAMPQDAYVAKSLKAGDTTFDLRDDNLRPNWAIAARGGRGGGPGMGAGRGPGQGRGPGPGGGSCYW